MRRDGTGRAHLHVLEGEILSVRAAPHAEARQLSRDGREDGHQRCGDGVNVDVDVVGANLLRQATGTFPRVVARVGRTHVARVEDAPEHERGGVGGGGRRSTLGG